MKALAITLILTLGLDALYFAHLYFALLLFACFFAGYTVADIYQSLFQ